MLGQPANTEPAKTTSYKVVLPFYVYAAFSFLVATTLLLGSAIDVTSHYFQPHTLAIVHIMALGWGTMIILGAAHQLVPVLIEASLYSNLLAYASFALAAIGIPLLVYGFYFFDMGWPAKCGGFFIIAGIISFLVNLFFTWKKSKHANFHAASIFTATIWLLITATAGLLVVFNFSTQFLPSDSLAYLPLHAHLGIIGWFLLLVVGVGSRLIPMFLISKYNNPSRLWWIYALINSGLVSYALLFLFTTNQYLLLFPFLALATAIGMFGNFVYRAYHQRIRKKLDQQMKISMLSVLMTLLPLLFVICIIVLVALSPAERIQLTIGYGFVIFFGWITAIILGMTFKTLPFIVWNKVYHQLAGKGKTPNPKDLFSEKIFRFMAIAYVAGFIGFTAAVFLDLQILLSAAAALLVLSSLMYNWNVIKIIMHKPCLL